MKDEDTKRLADGTTTRRVTLKSGDVLEGTLNRADDGIYNVHPRPTKSGEVQGGLLKEIPVEDIASIT